MRPTFVIPFHLSEADLEKASQLGLFGGETPIEPAKPKKEKPAGPVQQAFILPQTVQTKVGEQKTIFGHHDEVQSEHKPAKQNIVAIGPRGGKIIGYDNKNDPIYFNETGPISHASPAVANAHHKHLAEQKQAIEHQQHQLEVKKQKHELEEKPTKQIEEKIEEKKQKLVAVDKKLRTTAKESKKAKHDPNAGKEFRSLTRAPEDEGKLKELAGRDPEKVTAPDSIEEAHERYEWEHSERQRILNARHELAAREARTVTRPDGTKARKWEIRIDRIDGLKKKFEALAKKAKRLGIDNPPQMEVVGEPKRKKLKDYLGLSATKVEAEIVVREVHVWGGEIQIPDWEFVGKLEHVPGSKKNLVRAAPDREIPDRYWDAHHHCDHCKTNRDRKETFILRNKDGDYKQIGRSCLVDFTGHANADRLGAATSFAAEMDALMAEAGWGRDGGGDLEDSLVGARYLDPVDLMAHAYGLMKEHGYKRSGDYSGFGSMSTGEAALDVMIPPKGKSAVPPDPEHRAYAEKVKAWIEKKADAGGSSYFHNVSVALADARGASTRTVNLLASAVAAYQKDQGDQVKRSAVKQDASKREYVGEIGKRATFHNVTLLEEPRAFDSDYGTTYLHKFADPDGNLLIWWGSKDLTSEDRGGKKVGDRFSIKATPKKHEADRRDGGKVTVLNRVALEKSERDWLELEDPAGLMTGAPEPRKGDSMTMDLQAWLEKGGGVPGGKGSAKKSGEGSRGGKIIGHTKSGKPIYDAKTHPSYDKFTEQDHMDAVVEHGKKLDYEGAKRSGDAKDQHDMHRYAMMHHGEAMARKRFGKSEGPIEPSLELWTILSKAFTPDDYTELLGMMQVKPSGGMHAKQHSAPRESPKALPTGEAGGFGAEEGGNLEETPNTRVPTAPHPDKRTKDAGSSETLSIGSAEGGPLTRKSWGGQGYGEVELFATSGYGLQDHVRAATIHGGPDVPLAPAAPRRQALQKGEPEGEAWRHGELGIVYSTFEDHQIAKSMKGLNVEVTPTMQMLGQRPAILETEECPMCKSEKPAIVASCPSCGHFHGPTYTGQNGLVIADDVRKSLFPKQEQDILIK